MTTRATTSKKKPRAKKLFRVTKYAIIPIKSGRNGVYIPSKPIRPLRPIPAEEYIT